MKIEVYSDGSSDGKSGGVGGWAFVILIDGVVVHEGSGSEVNATNNSVEIKGAIEGLRYVDCYLATKPNPSGTLREVILWSDSQLVLGYATGRYRCKALHLLPLYIELRKFFGKLNAKDEWVKGHSGEPNNERCDLLAKAAREASNNQLQPNKDPSCP